MIYFDPGICHFGTNQEVLKEDLLLDDITILNINYIGFWRSNSDLCHNNSPGKRHAGPYSSHHPSLLCYAAHLYADDQLSRYLYEDTKRLVKLVEDAATLVERTGTAAFAEFGRKGVPLVRRSVFSVCL